ncbi:putative (diheme) protein [Candidatus Kuenenia stuttgartiensis]|jgi:hypothetical protein|uniref:Putative (Diheme) protein n=1 Tax=Kuenenia stuttgartiensis TaxID=174633 RepID=Q1Q6M1_KUEST|nr:hypothetical protein [Candidatus Kuenenia stuttgartiensis]MBZ0191362.1 hypothetical protein [Candidatus Kuenenia stuttgartiensis]MCF6151650.1 hypothetical protein [Candidatus Kuenenia stuttgartiensis]MCL4726634.1 hypothetical protein [Candidatus Kuenenia stuttgartiensis]QII12974.1 putative (diheme) protein [Candidatus Kuenenia stuttgartiensis]TVM01807.1 MAG: hypothetical protein CV080_03235 [Candidatus Kuenenia stuttgartiensis]
MNRNKKIYSILFFLILATGISVTAYYRSGNAEEHSQYEHAKSDVKNKLGKKSKKISFTNDILPLFTEPQKRGGEESVVCVRCHFTSLTIESSGIQENAFAEFSLGSYADIMAGADAGTEPIIDIEDPDISLLLQRLEGKGDDMAAGDARMPYGGPFFKKNKIKKIRTWIEQGAIDDTPEPDFNRDVLPLLTKSVNGNIPCSLCHYNNNDASSKERSPAQACMDLTSWEGIISGADGIEHEELVDRENPSNSLLVRRLRGQVTEEEKENDHRMPYGGPYFSEYEIQKIERWIASGAKGPNGEDPSEADISDAGVCPEGSGSGSGSGNDK